MPCRSQAKETGSCTEYRGGLRRGILGLRVFRVGHSVTSDAGFPLRAMRIEGDMLRLRALRVKRVRNENECLYLYTNPSHQWTAEAKGDIDQPGRNRLNT